nr:putative reverse transcriptase domain-containing protein [Tanacetum cinerariifolium]
MSIVEQEEEEQHSSHQALILLVETFDIGSSNVIVALVQSSQQWLHFSSGSGKFFCQWELYNWQWECLDDIDVADDVANFADVATTDAEHTLPSPTPVIIPPPPRQEVASTPLPSPHQSPIAHPSSPPQQQHSHTTNISMDLLNILLETCTTLTRKVENLEQDKIALALEITKLKQREDASKHGRRIAKLDADEDVTLEEVAIEVPKDAEDDEAEPTKLKEVIEVVTAAATTITGAPSAARRRKEFSYNNSYHASIKAAPFEALYGRKCRSRQKSYVDLKRRLTDFEVGDKVMLKVSPWKGVIRFGKRGKLSPRFIGSFKIIERIGPVAYKLELPDKLRGIHETFHVSNLKRCFVNDDVIIPLDEVQLDDKLHFVEEPVEIMDREVKQLK